MLSKKNYNFTIFQSVRTLCFIISSIKCAHLISMKIRGRDFRYKKRPFIPSKVLTGFSYATPTLCQDGLREPISLLTKLQSAEAPFRLELKHFFESFHVLGNHQFALNGDSLLGRLGADIFNSKCDRLKFMFMGYLVRFMEITVIHYCNYTDEC